MFSSLAFDRPVRSTAHRLGAAGCSSAADGLQPVAADHMNFRILGPLEVEEDSRAVDLGGARQRALLAILLVHRGEVVSVDRLIEDLYGARPPATAGKSLQAHISRLRKALGSDNRLHTRAGGYVLELLDSELDADRFGRLSDEGRDALSRGEAERAAQLLEEALALWRGPPLADIAYEEFAQSEIARLQELRLATVEELMEAGLVLGRHAALVGELEHLVAEQPLRERLRGQLMLALYHGHRQAEALAVYQQGRRMLADELGLEPGRNLQELERAILNHDPSLEPVATPAKVVAEVRPGRLAAGVFVGRERELAALEDALADARGGRGRLVLLAGEAGMGKSRLADELASQAKRLGMRVLWGRCWEAGGAPAYWPWVQALRTHVRECDPEALREQLGGAAPDLAHLLPELRELFGDVPQPPSLDSEGARFRLFDSTAAFLRRAATATPLLVVLDDMHAADAPSLLLLEFVAAELADARILVVATYRDPELATGDPTAVALADIARRASLRISLRGLGMPEVASYIELSSHVQPDASVVAAIMAETEGNPLFVGEIVRLLAADGQLAKPAAALGRLAIPETVKEVIGRRLSRLSNDCRETLALASVLGREFALNVIESLSGRAQDELLRILDEAIATRVVTDVPGAPGRMRFAHALIGDTLYDALPQGQRLELHRRAGEAIEATAGADIDARLSELAHHFFRALPAVDPDRVVEYARRAGDHAQAMLAHEEAARLYESALQALVLCQAPDSALECTLLLALGEALARAGDMPQAKDAFLRAAALARINGDAEDLAAAALGYGGRTVWSRPAKDRLVVALLEEALEALGDADTPLRARLLARLAGAHRDEPEPSRRVATGRLAVETARRTGDLDALSYALRGLCAAQHAIGDHDRRLEVVAELREVARQTEDKEGACEALSAEMLVYAELNDWDHVRELVPTFAALADELRQPSQRWFPAAADAMLALHDGRLDDAERLVPIALELGGRAEAHLAAAAYAIQLYLLRREQGRAEEALEPLTRFAAENPARPCFRCALASLLADVERLAEARQVFEELAPNGFEIVPRDNEWLLAAAFLVETCTALGDVTRAALLYEELAPLAARSTSNVPEGDAGTMARHLGVLAATLGRDDEAAAHLRAAIEIDERSGGRPWVAYARADLADVRGRQGAPDEAAALREAAATVAAELGLGRLAARIERSRRGS